MYPGHIQARWSSSNAQGPTDDAQRVTLEDNAHTQETNPSSSQPSAFGFQSLSGLFRSGTRASPSRALRPEDEQSLLNEVVRPDSANTATRSDDEIVGREVSRSTPDPLFDSAPPSDSTTHAFKSEPDRMRDTHSTTSDHRALTNLHRAPERMRFRKTSPSTIRKYVAGVVSTTSQRFAAAQDALVQSKLVPNPFVSRRRSTPALLRARQQLEPQQPWGLNTDDLQTIDSVAEPESSLQETFIDSDNVSPASPARIKNETSAKGGSALTHVQASGEARMVDVGAKPHSRRVAIACAVVTFANPEPFKLIFEDSNKKGDVLGVSRIAGIMAAKRTSDLIPLCHPVAISRSEVDVKLVAPNAYEFLNSKNKFGSVSIQALVECTGPTGIEMEALTAANIAALTVYDMCKAVDRSIRVGPCLLVYKSGGKSGLYVNSGWASRVGRQFFVERQLDSPPYKAKKAGAVDLD